ncbi:MAG: hypothetical protein U5K43_00475 [Halofilum sp. (in: g-proteobacteria)]|nr:hypothetical protein [Halofilum sp. (in: g-proteobacteria)]
MRALRFALRALPRDARLREMRVLALALVIAVGALSAVGFFTDRVQRSMAAQATALLGADLVLESHDPLPPAWTREAEARDLRTAGYVTFPSVVVAGERTELVAVKAVGSAYPLRGQLRVAPAPARRRRAGVAGAATRQRVARPAAVRPARRRGR